MGRADVYLQPHAADPVLSAATVARIAAVHTAGAGAVRGVDESGGEARAYLLAGDVVVKTQRPHRLRPRTSLAKEARLLEHLAERLGQRVPHVYGYGRVDAPEGEVEYLVLARMPGRATRHAAVKGEVRTELLRDTGRLLARMHAVPAEALRDDGLIPVDPDGAALRHRLGLGFEDLAELVAQQPERWTSSATIEDAAARAVDLIPRSFAPVALHSNPGPTHVFCDDAGALTGLIDFGDAYISHPAMDLRAWPDPADRLSLRDGYLEVCRPAAEFEAAWTAAMIYADVAAIAARPELSEAATADLTVRLAAF